MGKIPFLFVFISFSTLAQTQSVPRAINPQFDQIIRKYLKLSITPISVREANQSGDILFLDTRELEEYRISHIKGARFIGFKDFSIESLSDIDPDQKIILYCSIGYRSEIIGEKLKAIGFSNLYNLYGSIFEWVNNGFPVYDMEENRTRKIHTYSKSWGKWVDASLAYKTW